ncbi:MAG: antitoxin [Nitrosopumilaceae archaeon]|nr:antitoxin [Nitrosopumilaceae archaeon]NIX62301.1 antitoxin [Nitrosopumilaceae archaeon]
MAILQVRDIDDELYKALKKRAKMERRSMSQEVIKIIEMYLQLSPQSRKNSTSTEEFLNLSWVSDKNESAEDIINQIRSKRINSGRFSGEPNVFD